MSFNNNININLINLSKKKFNISYLLISLIIFSKKWYFLLLTNCLIFLKNIIYFYKLKHFIFKKLSFFYFLNINIFFFDIKKIILLNSLSPIKNIKNINIFFIFKSLIYFFFKTVNYLNFVLFSNNLKKKLLKKKNLL